MSVEAVPGFASLNEAARAVAAKLRRRWHTPDTGRGWFVTVVEDAALELESLRMAAIDRSHAVRRAAAEKRTATRAKRRK